MGSNGSGKGSKDGRQPSKPPAESSAGSSSSGAFSKLDVVQKAFMAPFTNKKNDSTRILAERAYSYHQAL